MKGLEAKENGVPHTQGVNNLQEEVGDLQLRNYASTLFTSMVTRDGFTEINKNDSLSSLSTTNENEEVNEPSGNDNAIETSEPNPAGGNDERNSNSDGGNSTSLTTRRTSETPPPQLTYRERLFQSMDITQGCNSINARRLVTKEGIVDVKYINSPGIKTRFIRDLFHTLMDARWRYNCLLFTLSFLISWLFFGTIWYVIVHFRNIDCVDNVDTWVKAFLFSIETQTTIGYGGRAVRAECPEGVILLAVQTIIGMFIQCFILGLIFGKLARPKNRGRNIMFSKNAVITVRDGYFCLLFRYADLCRRVLLDSNIRMVIIRPRLTEEGEYIPLDMADLALTIDYEQVEYTMRLFPLFPITVIHMIDEESPLYNMSKANLRNRQFEIVAILEGTVPTTGNTTQALTSYRPDEILWGHRLKAITLAGEGLEEGLNNIDINMIHGTVKEDVTPEYSAEEFDRRNEEEDEEEDDDEDGEGDEEKGGNGAHDASSSSDSD